MLLNNRDKGLTNKFGRIVYFDIVVLTYVIHGAIAKWLQRQIRNLFLFEGAGSNPAGVEKEIILKKNSFFILTVSIRLYFL